MSHESTVHPAVTAEPDVQPAKGFALAAFLCGLASVLCCALVAAVAGLIFGGIAKKKGNTSRMCLTGEGFCMVGIVSSLLIPAILAAMAPSLMAKLDPQLFTGILGNLIPTETVEATDTEPDTTAAPNTLELLEFFSTEEGGYVVSVKDGATLPEVVTIPATYRNGKVTEIGMGGFEGQIHLKEIRLPDTLTRIDGGAFRGCESLEKVEIPDKVAYIGPSAFERCVSLAYVAIPAGVTALSDHCFYECDSLAEVILPDTLTRIEDSAFAGCGQLPGITIPNSVSHIGSSAFSGCIMPSISLPSNLTFIGMYAFNGDFLDSLSYPGTTEDWEYNVVKEEDWYLQTLAQPVTVNCANGSIVLTKE